MSKSPNLTMAPKDDGVSQGDDRLELVEDIPPLCMACKLLGHGTTLNTGSKPARNP